MIDDVKARVHTCDLVEELMGKAPTKDAQGWMGLCPIHGEKNPSLRIFESGGFRCFSCGASGGDVIDFWASYREIDTTTAIRELARERGSLPAQERPKLRLVDPPPEAPPAQPIPEAAIPKPGQVITMHSPDKTKKPEKVKPTVVYTYRDQQGVARSVVLRLERGGRKQFRPGRWDGQKWWKVGADTPRPLYGLEHIGPQTVQVILVEGEKAADAARAQLPDQLAVVTWPGGAQAIESIDWGPLHGARVLLWPDNDPAGKLAMHAIGRALAGHAEELRIITPGDKMPEKGDAADLEVEDLVDWMRSHVEPWVEPDAAIIEQLEAAMGKAKPKTKNQVETPKGVEPRDPFNPDATKATRSRQFPFHILGQRDAHAYFLKKVDGEIITVPFSRLARRETLGMLAREDVWRKAFVPPTRDPDDKPIGWPTIGAAAMGHIMDVVEAMPRFDPSRTRGRGCWPHQDTIAFNQGDQVEIDGHVERENYLDRTVYERRPPLPIDRENPLTAEEGNELVKMLELCSWVDPNAAYFLAGWIALAPICGALTWRPHVWVTGPAGCGKSYIMDNIVQHAIGSDWALRIAGGTTEAGIRQSMEKDALPVLLDEAEPDSPKSAAHMEAILTLARSASAGDKIVKGSAGNAGAVRFEVRSAFAFSAINTAIAAFADETRITRLVLRKDVGAEAEGRYNDLKERVARILGRDFGPRLVARMVKRSGDVLRTIERCEDAITRRFGHRRLAQQYGALLGGMWVLHRDEQLTDEDADDLASLVPEHSVRVQVEDTDAQQLLEHLSTYRLGYADHGPRKDVTISELIDWQVSPQLDAFGGEKDVSRDEAHLVLQRVGIKIKKVEHATGYRDMVAIAINHTVMADQVLRDTPWRHSYSDRLKEIQGASRGPQLRFAGSKPRSTVLVPVEAFVGGEDG